MISNFLKEQFDLCIKNPLLYFKENIVLIPVFVTLVLCIFLIFRYSTEMITAVLTAFGFIFVALKYKLDRASYEKDLFEKRYKILEIIFEVLHEWAGHQKVSGEILDKLGKDFLWKAYYLFNTETYTFIKKFRSAIILAQYSDKFKDDASKQKSEEARDFLIKFIDNQENTLDKFPELKLTIY